MENKIKFIDGEHDSWLSVQDIDPNAEIADGIQTISCDTRDFAIGWGFKEPELFKKASCGLEVQTNAGLSKLQSLFTKPNKERYVINKKDIFKWLDELCKQTGGYECEWRYLSANVKNCSDWDIKYIRFVRNNKNRDEFVVCNSYMFPIHYKEIIQNINKEYLNAY